MNNVGFVNIFRQFSTRECFSMCKGVRKNAKHERETNIDKLQRSYMFLYTLARKNVLVCVIEYVRMLNMWERLIDKLERS